MSKKELIGRVAFTILFVLLMLLLAHLQGYQWTP